MKFLFIESSGNVYGEESHIKDAYKAYRQIARIEGEKFAGALALHIDDNNDNELVQFSPQQTADLLAAP